MDHASQKRYTLLGATVFVMFGIMSGCDDRDKPVLDAPGVWGPDGVFEAPEDAPLNERGQATKDHMQRVGDQIDLLYPDLKI